MTAVFDYQVTIVTAPTTEPVSLTEAKRHLRMSSDSLDVQLEDNESIAKEDHVVAADYSLIGTGVSLEGKETLVVLISGTNGAGSTVDVKLQESLDDVTYTDVASGAFTQVTTANDNARFELVYSGVFPYVRVVSTVAVATCNFGVDIITKSANTSDDDDVSSMIQASREYLEDVLIKKAFITQTRSLHLKAFPGSNFINLPFPPLVSVTSVTYTDSDDTENTFSSASYRVDTDSQDFGRVWLKDNVSWPAFTKREGYAVKVTYVCGYGAASTVPDKFKLGIRNMVTDMYKFRENTVMGSVTRLDHVMNMLKSERRYYSVN